MSNQLNELIWNGESIPCNNFATEKVTYKMNIPPNNQQAEQAVLGTMLLRPDSVPLAISKLTAIEFYRQSHQVLFSAINVLFLANNTVDTITLSNQLNKDGKLEEIGGMAYIAFLTSIIPSVRKIENHCDIITEAHRLRSMIALSDEIKDNCYSLDSAASVTDDFGKKFFAIAAGKNEEAQMIGDFVGNVVDKLHDRMETGISGIPTGFMDLDRLTSGISPSELIILAARPAMGKTTLAMNIIENITEGGKTGLFFSLEMDKDQLAERMLSRKSGVSFGAIRNGFIKDEDWPKLVHQESRISKLPLIIDDTPALSVTQIRARAKMLYAKYGLDVIVVDYLQLLTGKGENRTNEVSNISRQLKALAKELGIPVIALSQLNRSLESRPDKRPLMSDLRESGAIEQDADIIIFIYRDEVYNKAEDNPLKGIAEVIVSKQRNGPTGTVNMIFDGSHTRFLDSIGE